MKKFLYLLPIFIFALTLFGCDSSNSTSSTSTTTTNNNYTITQEVDTAVKEIQTSNATTSLNFYQDDLDSDCLEIINHIKSFKSENLTNSEKQNLIKEIDYFVDNYKRLQESYIELDTIETNVYNELFPYYEYYYPLVEQLSNEYQALLTQYPNYYAGTESDYLYERNYYQSLINKAYANYNSAKQSMESYLEQMGLPGTITPDADLELKRQYLSNVGNYQYYISELDIQWQQRLEIKSKYNEYASAYNTLYTQKDIVTQKYRVDYDYAKQTLELDRQYIYERMDKEL